MTFRNDRQNRHAKAIKALGLDGTLIGFAYAAVETVWSVFIFSFYQSESNVGFITALFSLITLLSLLFTFPLFKKFTAQQILFVSVGANAIVLALFAHTNNKELFLILGIINSILMGIRIQSFGILLRHNSSKKEINHDENYVYLLMNLGWIAGPLISGYIANVFEIKAVMVIASAALLFSVYSITYNQKSFKRENVKSDEEEFHIIDNIKTFFKDKKRFFAYCLSGGLEVWWVIAYIFVPVYIIKHPSFDIGDVGVYLFATVSPLIITEYIMQRIKIKSFRKTIGKGYIIAASIGIIAASTSNIYVMLVALVVSSFGIGLVEPTVESYFFSITKENESKKYYGSFMTAKQVGSFIGKTIVACVLLFSDLQMSIFIISIFVFTLGMISLKGKK